MNKLTEEEFQDRVQAVARARKIFIKLTEGNISNAFILYQEVLAEKDRPLTINTAIAGTRPRTFMDNFQRPKCPECGSEMNFRPVKDNEEGIKTQLVCSNQSCDTVLDSDMDIGEWMKTLEKVDGSEQTKAV
jgi:hypothetical protein